MAWQADPTLAESFAPDQWAITHAPAANTQATISRAALAGGQHVCTAVSFTAVSGTTAPTVDLATVNLRNGATGAGTVLQSWSVAFEATAGRTVVFSLSGLKIPASDNTAMTLEFDAASGANTLQSVALVGYSRVTP